MVSSSSPDFSLAEKQECCEESIGIQTLDNGVILLRPARIGDRHMAAALVNVVGGLVAGRERRLIISLGDVPNVSGAMWLRLFALHRICRDSGGELLLCQLLPTQKFFLTMAHANYFRQFDTVEEAAAAF